MIVGVLSMIICSTMIVMFISAFCFGYFQSFLAKAGSLALVIVFGLVHSALSYAVLDHSAIMVVSTGLISATLVVLGQAQHSQRTPA